MSSTTRWGSAWACLLALCCGIGAALHSASAGLIVAGVGGFVLILVSWFNE